MTWISLIGITLAVFALIATLSVRSGFRAEFVDTILGANAHVTVYQLGEVAQNGQIDRSIADYKDMAAAVAQVPGVIRAAPLIRQQVMANKGQSNAGVEVFGIAAADLKTIPRIANSANAVGDINRFDQGMAMGVGVARTLGVNVGDRVKLISPNGVKTAFGTSPRVNAYEVVYIFEAGRYDIDRTRIYLPFAQAQTFFNRAKAIRQISQHRVQIIATANPVCQTCRPCKTVQIKPTRAVGHRRVGVDRNRLQIQPVLQSQKHVMGMKDRVLTTRLQRHIKVLTHMRCRKVQLFGGYCNVIKFHFFEPSRIYAWAIPL